MNRSDYLIRLLKYYQDLGFEGQILIGDSSEQEHVRRTKAALASMGGQLDVVYKEYPNISDSVCMEMLIGLVSTPYVAFVADDDFLIPAALEQCAEFLDNHPDYSAAHGVATMIRLEQNGAYGRITDAYAYEQAVIEEATATQRLQVHLARYRATMFSVHRLETWRAMAKNISSVPARWIAAELILSSLTVVAGKVKELDCLYLVRQHHDSRYLFPDIFDSITSPTWVPSYESYRDRVAEELVRQDGISIEDALQVAKRGIWSYLEQSLRNKSEGWSAPKQLSINLRLRRIGRRSKFLRSLWHQVHLLYPMQGRDLSLAGLLRPRSQYHADFMPIYKSITDSDQVER